MQSFVVLLRLPHHLLGEFVKSIFCTLSSSCWRVRPCFADFSRAFAVGMTTDFAKASHARALGAGVTLARGLFEDPTDACCDAAQLWHRILAQALPRLASEDPPLCAPINYLAAHLRALTCQ